MEQSSLFQIGVSSLLLLQMAFWTLVSRLWRFRFLSFFVCYPPRVLSLLPCYFFTQPDFHSSGSRWTHSLGWWLSAKRHGRPLHTTLHIAELIVYSTLYARNSFRRSAVIKQFLHNTHRPTYFSHSDYRCLPSPYTHTYQLRFIMKNVITLNSIKILKNLALIRCRCGLDSPIKFTYISTSFRMNFDNWKSRRSQGLPTTII
jgi:hypothetical protein